MNRNRDCVRRLVIKRQLRKAGFEIPELAMYDLAALRALRSQLFGNS